MATIVRTFCAADMPLVVLRCFVRRTRPEANQLLGPEAAALAEQQRGYHLYMEFIHDRKCEPRGLLETLRETRD